MCACCGLAKILSWDKSLKTLWIILGRNNFLGFANLIGIEYKRTMTKPDTKEIRKKYGNVIVQQDEYGTITKSYPDVLNLCDAYDEAQREIERLKVFEDFIKTVGPFEIVEGDAIHRKTPSSRQVLNTNTNWLVSQDSRQFSRSTMALKKLLETIDIKKELGE